MYRVDMSNVIKMIRMGFVYLIIAIIVTSTLFLFSINFNPFPEASLGFSVQGKIIPGFIILIGIIVVAYYIRFVIYAIKRKHLYEDLSQCGVLYKNLPYKVLTTDFVLNNREVMGIVVDFTLPSGVVVRLRSDVRYNHKLFDKDGFVDVLMDPNDSSRYLIELNIEKI